MGSSPLEAIVQCPSPLTFGSKVIKMYTGLDMGLLLLVGFPFGSPVAKTTKERVPSTHPYK